jgi:type IX secretion system PorP/SprF family membrane protein
MDIRHLFLQIVLLLIAGLTCNAQQELLYTQYVYNELIINPAYAGYHETLNLSLNTRKKWVGLNGSPFTTTLAGHGILNGNNPYWSIFKKKTNKARILQRKKDDKIGLGFLIYNDRMGVDNTLLASISTSYKIYFDESRLSFGLQASVMNYTQNFTKLDGYNPNDPAFYDNIRKTMLNFGTGIFFDNDRYYVGVSIPQIVENYLDNTSDKNNRQLRQYFVTGGYLFYLSEYFKLKPSFMFRYTEEIPAQLDITGMVIYQDRIFWGVSYRNKNTMSAIFQVSFVQNLKMGMAYDYTFGKLQKASNGTVEVLLNYNFNSSVNKVINPRYF